MAREAKQIYIAHLEQMDVRRAVRRMAYGAAFDPRWLVLVYEWPALVGVAGIANLIFSHRSAQLMWPFSSMGVMAIGTLDEPFIHAMPEWHRELRFLLLMAGIAKRRLRLHQQELARLGVVRRMARRAGDIVP
jgi:hypothetical protein